MLSDTCHPAGVQETVGHRFLYTCRPAGAKELWVSLFLYTISVNLRKGLRFYKHLSISIITEIVLYLVP